MTKPLPARPDEKDWTWVLERQCDECGANVGSLTVSQVAALNRESAQRWVELLGGDESWVRTRPKPDTWSPLEYGCHVRDVYRLFLERLQLILSQENPTFANWDPNITAEAERYDLAEPGEVAAQLSKAAEDLATAFDTVTPGQLQRNGLRSDGAEFTLETFARYELHDPEHHLWDVTGQQSVAGLAP
jgi:hypothetical protein